MGLSEGAEGETKENGERVDRLFPFNSSLRKAGRPNGPICLLGPFFTRRGLGDDAGKSAVSGDTGALVEAVRGAKSGIEDGSDESPWVRRRSRARLNFSARSLRRRSRSSLSISSVASCSSFFLAASSLFRLCVSSSSIRRSVISRSSRRSFVFDAAASSLSWSVSSSMCSWSSRLISERRARR